MSSCPSVMSSPLPSAGDGDERASRLSSHLVAAETDSLHRRLSAGSEMPRHERRRVVDELAHDLDLNGRPQPWVSPGGDAHRGPVIVVPWTSVSRSSIGGCPGTPASPARSP